MNDDYVHTAHFIDDVKRNERNETKMMAILSMLVAFHESVSLQVTLNVFFMNILREFPEIRKICFFSIQNFIRLSSTFDFACKCSRNEDALNLIHFDLCEFIRINYANCILNDSKSYDFICISHND